jgi:hypothetical protein
MLPGITLGNFVLHDLRWCLNNASQPCSDARYISYWPIWGAYAVQDYHRQFGAAQQPPAIWTDYASMGAPARPLLGMKCLLAVLMNNAGGARQRARQSRARPD